MRHNPPIPHEGQRTEIQSSQRATCEDLLCDDLLPHTPDTVLRDYNFRRYEQVAFPANPLHNATLLLYLARQMNLREQVYSILDKLWSHLGKDQVVWGAKWTLDRFDSFEFYVYNREEPRPLRRRSVSGLRAALTPWIDHIAPPKESCNYTMCSFDLKYEDAAVGRASGMHIYVAGGSEKRRHESFSYGLEHEGTRLENHYTWYYANSELDELRERLGWSVHASQCTANDHLLPQQLLDCLTISFATKTASDGLYFNQIRTEQLVWFAAHYLPVTVSYGLAACGSSFDHVMWDVGFDFTVGHGTDGDAAPVKFGIYGCV